MEGIVVISLITPQQFRCILNNAFANYSMLCQAELVLVSLLFGTRLFFCDHLLCILLFVGNASFVLLFV